MLINLLKKIKTIDYINNIPIEIIILVIVAASPCFLFNIMPIGIDNGPNAGRIILLAERIKNFDFPIYVNFDTFKGYGSLDFVFYPYGSIIIPALIQIITNNIIFTTNLYIFFIILFQTYIVYISTNCIYEDKNISIVSSILFTLSYSNVLNIFFRAGYYEVIAISFIPLIIVGTYKTFFSYVYKDKSLYIIIGITGMLQSHVITSVFFITLLTIVFLIAFPYIIKNGKFGILVRTIITSLIINLWFLYPFIKSYFIESITISNDLHFLPLQSITDIFNRIPMTFHSISFSNFRVYKSLNNLYTYTELFFLCIYIYVFASKFKRVEFKFNLLDRKYKISFIMLCFFLFHCLNYTQFFQEIFNIEFIKKFFSLEQFNIRELERGMPFYVLAVAPVVAYIFKTRNKRLLLIVLMFATSLYIYAQQFIDPENGFSIRKTSKFLLYNVNSNDEIYDIIFDKWMITDYIPSGYDGTELSREIDTNCSIDNVVIEEKKCEFDFLSDNNVKKSFILPYFKYYGYKAYLNGEKYNGISEHNGKIELTTNLQNGHFKIEYKKPIDFLVSFYISFCFIICILIYRVISWRRKVNVQKY